MAKNISKIYQRTAFIILVIIISGLFNICLFALQAKAAAPKLFAPKINFADNNYYSDDEACATETTHGSKQSLNRPVAPMPQCCLAQNRYYNAVVNTANDQPTRTFVNLMISPINKPNFENNSTYYTSRLIHPPPAALALVSTVIREWSLIYPASRYRREGVPPDRRFLAL